MAEPSPTSLDQMQTDPQEKPEDDLLQSANFQQKQNEQRTIAPFIFNTYNMPKINCFYHAGQTVTNFCRCEQCLLPLCPECVKEHVNEHSEDKSYPKLDCLENILTEVHQEVYLQALELVKNFAEIEKSVSQAHGQTMQTMDRLKEAKLRINKIVDQYFNALENELDNKQKKNLEHFQRDAKCFTQVINDRYVSHGLFLDSLKQPDCMYSLLPYLQSTTIEDNQLYNKTAKVFSNRFKEIQSQIIYDQAKSNQLSSLLGNIVQVSHFDLHEFLDMHKLAPADIIKSKVLTVSQSNTKSIKKPQQSSLKKKTVQVLDQEQLIISEPPLLIDPQMTVRYQQPQYSQPKATSQYYSQPQLVNKQPYPQQAYPQQAYPQQAYQQQAHPQQPYPSFQQTPKSVVQSVPPQQYNYQQPYQNPQPLQQPIRQQFVPQQQLQNPTYQQSYY